MNELHQRIVNKVNEGQEPDVVPYTYETIPNSIKWFWIRVFRGDFGEYVKQLNEKY